MSRRFVLTECVALRYGVLRHHKTVVLALPVPISTNYVSFTLTNTRKHFFFVRVVEHWNDLNTHTIDFSSLKRFKSSLRKKSFLGLPEVFRGLNVLFVTFCLSVYVCLLFMLDIFRVLF